MIKAIIFTTITIANLFVSWHSLRNPRSYGFPRFFAFEATLGLIFINIKHWLDDPFSLRQWVSWVCLSASGFLVLHGVHLLHLKGQPAHGFEQTTQLVRSGAYGFIRHPLYSSVLFLAWGAFLKQVSLPSCLLILGASFSLLATAWNEERLNLQKFGEEYSDYMRQTKRFIPFIV